MNNDKREPCCELCAVYWERGGGTCDRSTCKCHHSGEKEEPTQTSSKYAISNLNTSPQTVTFPAEKEETLVEGDWESEFDELFRMYAYHPVTEKLVREKIKSFIRNTLSQEREALKGELMEKVKDHYWDSLYPHKDLIIKHVLSLLHDKNK